MIERLVGSLCLLLLIGGIVFLYLVGVFVIVSTWPSMRKNRGR